jgi:hypothetical protein
LTGFGRWRRHVPHLEGVEAAVALENDCLHCGSRRARETTVAKTGDTGDDSRTCEVFAAQAAILRVNLRSSAPEAK